MSTDPGRSIRDFIYLDLPRVVSIFSQLTGGLITGTEVTTGTEKDERNIRTYDLKVFKPEFGGASKESRTYVETRIMHHDLFSAVEQLLFEHGYALDINQALSAQQVVSGHAHDVLRNKYMGNPPALPGDSQSLTDAGVVHQTHGL